MSKIISLYDEKLEKYALLDIATEQFVVPFVLDEIKPYGKSFPFAGNDAETIFVKMDGKYWVMNKAGERIGELPYDRVSYFPTHDLQKVILDGKIGWVDKFGKLVIPCVYEDDFYASKHFKDKTKTIAAKRDGKYCIVDGEGKEVGVEADRFMDAEEGNREYYIIIRDKMYGLIDAKGNEIIPCEYKSGVTYFCEEGMAMAGKAKRKWAIFNKEGKALTKFIYDSPDDHTFLFRNSRLNFNRNGLAFIAQQDKLGIINKDLQEVVPFIYDAVLDYMIDGKFPASWKDIEDETTLIEVKKDNNVGYINFRGEEVVPTIYRSYHQSFSMGNYFTMRSYEFFNGVAAVYQDKKWGCLDIKGKEIMPCIYSWVSNFIGGCTWAKDAESGKWGGFDRNGRQIIPFIYDNVRYFRNGAASVIKDGKEGYIDLEGKELTSFIYDRGYPMDSMGCAIVVKDGKRGLVNMKGEEVLNCIYDNVKIMYAGVYSVEKDGKIGLVGTNGEFLIPCDYDSILNCNNGVACVIRDGKYGCVRAGGEEVAPFVYSSADGEKYSAGVFKVQKEGMQGFLKDGVEIIPCEYEKAELLSVMLDSDDEVLTGKYLVKTTAGEYSVIKL